VEYLRERPVVCQRPGGGQMTNRVHSSSANTITIAGTAAANVILIYEFGKGTGTCSQRDALHSCSKHAVGCACKRFVFDHELRAQRRHATGCPDSSICTSRPGANDRPHTEPRCGAPPARSCLLSFTILQSLACCHLLAPARTATRCSAPPPSAAAATSRPASSARRRRRRRWRSRPPRTRSSGAARRTPRWP
jgi:hypothetical protein